MRRSIKFLIAGCLAGALGLAGCGGTSTPTDDAATDVVQSQEEVAQSEPEPEEPEGPSEADLETYFEALSSNDPDQVRDVLPLTVPGSIAYTYATYYAGLQQSIQDAGIVNEDLLIVSRTDDGFEGCPEEPTEDNPCLYYTNIQHEDDKIADFDLNGESLHELLTLGDGEAVPLGEIAEITQVASYASVGYVVCIFEITSKADGLGLWVEYVAPDGQEHEMNAWAGPESVPTDSSGTYSFWFEDAEFGGTVVIDGSASEPVDGVYETVSAEFSTK